MNAPPVRRPITRYRFNRHGDVIVDSRTLAPTFDTNDYEHWHPIFEPRHSSPARIKFKADRAARRKADPFIRDSARRHAEQRAEKRAVKAAMQKLATAGSSAADAFRIIAAASKGVRP